MILRRRQESNFTTLGNALIEDERLSYEALGMITYLLSRPHNWKVHVRQLCAHRKGAGRDRVYRIINELIRAGYITRSINRSAGGKVASVEYDVTGTPQATAPLPEKPDTANQDDLLSNERDKVPLLLSHAAECGDAARALDEGAFPEVWARWTRGRESFSERKPESSRRARASWARLTDSDRYDVEAYVGFYFTASREAGRTWPWSFATYITSGCWKYPRLVA